MALFEAFESAALSFGGAACFIPRDGVAAGRVRMV
jgi:hypothetical protein